MIKIRNKILISEEELKFAFIRSSGPGGQNVNKVSSAVQLKFDVLNSESLSEKIKSKLMSIAGRRITKDGVLIIEAKRYRTQDKNKKDAIERLITLIRKSSEIVKPRRKTKPTKASLEKRISGKKKKSQLKKQREKVTKIFE
jgi:ribosome-associated protein